MFPLSLENIVSAIITFSVTRIMQSSQVKCNSMFSHLLCSLSNQHSF